METWLGEDPVLTSIHYRNVQYGILNDDFNDQRVPTVFRLLAIGRLLANADNTAKVLQTSLVSAIGEMLASAVPDNRILDQGPARASLIASVHQLRTHQLSNMFINVAEAPYGAIIEGLRPVGWRADDWTSNEFEACYRCLLYMAVRAVPNVKLRGELAVAYILVAVMKRGTTSPGFLTKVSNDLQSELGHAVDLNEDIIKKLYNFFGRYVNAENIEAIAASWTELLPGHIMRLRLTISQIAGSGLTCLTTIGKALKDYDDFDWVSIQRMFPVEWNRFLAAVAAVGNNPYYGFNTNLEVVKSTNYKSLAFVAKELLIRAGGMSALKAYGGFPRNIPNEQQVMNMIRDYIDGRLVLDPLTAEEQNAYRADINQVIGTLIANNHVYL